MKILQLLLGLLFLCGCTDELPHTYSDKPFILLVYLAADNDLSGEASQKLEAIRQGVTSEVNSRVFVYQDSQTESPRLMELKANKSETGIEIIKEYPEHNSASADVFAGVIRQVTDLAPADRYGLLLFSHASGWLPEAALSNPAGVTRSIGRDGTDEMELADFAAAIPDGLFEYIVFEACFMAGIEVANALKDKADYLLVSSAEIVSPGFTPVYPSSFFLLQKGVTGLEPFAEAAFNHYNTQTGWQQSTTFSIIQTAFLSPLLDFIRSTVPLGEDIDLAAVQSFDRYSRHLFFDLEDCYTQLLHADADRQQLTSLIEACVIWKAATPYFLPGHQGFVIKKHCGLTTYHPQARFPGLNRLWEEIMF